MAEDRIDRKGAEGPDLGEGGEASEKLLVAKETIEGLLEKLGVPARVEMKESADLMACRIEPEGAESPIFEGPEGRQALLALEYLANRIVNRSREERKRIVLAIGEEVEAGDEALAVMAERLASSLTRMNRPLTLVGMDARHRRIVHLTLAERGEVRTKSVGEGALRRIVIEPARSEE